MYIHRQRHYGIRDKPIAWTWLDTKHSGSRSEDIWESWCSPRVYSHTTSHDYIFENQQRNAERHFPNVEFMTYTKLLRLSEEALMALRPETIILDEFHRCGAYCWGQGVERLLRAYPAAKVMGLSATPIRYLDNCRNMAEELFTVDGRFCVASEMTLGEAIVRDELSLDLAHGRQPRAERAELVRLRRGQSEVLEVLVSGGGGGGGGGGRTLAAVMAVAVAVVVSTAATTTTTTTAGGQRETGAHQRQQ